MGDATKMVYIDNASAQAYREWRSYPLDKKIVSYTNLHYFGDLTSKRLVDFGCGNGLFLKKCFESGSSFCLGFDTNEAMIVAGGNTVTKNQIQTSEKLHFAVQDCFQTIEQHQGQFDFATCHFLLHSCSSKTKLETFFQNAIRLLKPGGRMFIGQEASVVKTLKDQETIADLSGTLRPLESGLSGDEPAVAEVPAFYPAPASISKTGRPFTRKVAFKFTDYIWSNEKLMTILEKVGFVNIRLLQPIFPDDVPSFERERVQSLKEPLCLIGAEKPDRFS